MDRTAESPDWEVLKAIEEKRRSLLVYDAGSQYTIVYKRFRGTILQYILRDALFWITISMFIGVRVLFRYIDGGTFWDADNDNPLGGSSSINTIGTFLSLILTFFINQARSDFASAYVNSMKAKGKIMEMATITKAVLPKERAQRLVRYLNAAHLAGYAGLSDIYSRENFFDKFNKDMSVLTEKELYRLDEVDSSLTGGSNCWEIVTWAMQDIQDALNAGDVDNRTASSLRAIVLDFRGAMSTMFNSADQPSVTFFYIHLVSFLCCIYLPLFAMYSAFEASQYSESFTLSDIIQGLVVFVQSCYVIGMRLLAIKLMDPFGADIEDLSVMTYVRTCWETSNKILNVNSPGEEILKTKCLDETEGSTSNNSH
jgi:predicted membrane chloride channel (bestrophin family)